MSSLQTVEEFVNNDLMQEVYTNLRTRFDIIKRKIFRILQIIY